MTNDQTPTGGKPKNTWAALAQTAILFGLILLFMWGTVAIFKWA